LLALSGKVDTRGARELERKLTSLVGSGERRFVVDFARVTTMTGLGLRVLLAFSNRLEGNGGLVLCSLSETVKSVLDISDLRESFAVSRSTDEAISKARESRRISAVTSAVTRVLGADSSDLAPGSDGEPSRLAGVVSQALASSIEDKKSRPEEDSPPGSRIAPRESDL